MNIRKRMIALLLGFSMVFACSGCMAANVEELYSLPRMSEEYVQLQELIDQRIDAGGEYAAPLSGSHRQSVQLQDLSGDGEPEAIAFLADESHTPTICIYRRDDQGLYYLFVVITGEGSAVSSVDYADLNGDGTAEFIIAWQIGGDLQLLSAYALSGEIPVELLSVDCGRILVRDADGDGTEEILDLRADYDNVSTLKLYDIGTDNAVSQSQAALSGGIGEILRARMGYLTDGSPALFVESRCLDSELLITDVFAVRSGALQNITMTDTGVSNTRRESPAFATDINGDRAMEIPESSGGLLNWYALDGAGRRTLALTTYHDYDDGWYFVLEDGLLSGLTVERTETAAGEVSVVFSRREEGELFAIYTLTGENRLDRADEEGRFLLAEEETTVYAGEILSGALTEEDLHTCFNLIYSEWQTGDL